MSVYIHPELDLEIDPFQKTLDAHMQARVGNIIPLVGKLLVEPENISNRPKNHPTVITSNFIPADTNSTATSMKYCETGVSNFAEAVEVIDEEARLKELKEAKQLFLIAPHLSMEDILVIAYLLNKTEYMEDRDASDISMPLSVQLAHTVFKPTGKNVATGLISPVCNIIPVIPATKTTQPLRDAYPQHVSEYNDNSMEAAAEFKQTKQGVQHVTILAPSASRAKSKRLGTVKEIQEPPSSSYTILRKGARDGAAIVILETAFSPLGFVRGVPRQPVKVHIERTILPDDPLISDKKAFIEAIRTGLLAAGQNSTWRRVRYSDN